MSAVKVNAPKAATATVIFFHGLGDSGEGWSFLPGEVYRRTGLQHIKFVLPNAPVRLIKVFGQEAPAWYDVGAFGPGSSQDVEGTMTALNTVKAYIEEEIKNGVPPERIVVGGFSQGSSLTMGTAVTLDKKIAGFIPISGFVPVVKAIEPLANPANLDTPILQMHGTADEIVPFKTGVVSNEILRNKFHFTNIDWREYPGLAHNVNPKGLNDILDFLEKVVPAI